MLEHKSFLVFLRGWANIANVRYSKPIFFFVVQTIVSYESKLIYYQTFGKNLRLYVGFYDIIFFNRVIMWKYYSLKTLTTIVNIKIS